mgnify:CR=1 FL=1|tara:strand:+ start:1170 stop:1535 length:366 start_codon:yes stop_codon:yes gene_type:complete
MSEIVIFNKSDNSYLMSASSLPSEIYKDETKYVIAKLPEGEKFDLNYSYSHKDGVAIKGDLLPVDKDAVKKLEDEWKAQQYQRDRQEEYPDIVDQLDDLYHNGIEGWKKTIKAIKDKYPKG